MFTLSLLFLVSADQVVTVREPRAASPWVQSVRANCGDAVLEISGYGAARPLDRTPPELRINGRPAVGEKVEQMLSDLSHRSSVYRLQILCGDPERMTVRIDEGERQRDGTVRYRSSAAFIRGDRLESYTGYQEADADSFWFR